MEDLTAIEKQVKALLPRLSRAVVAVQVGAASGSGVVVSEDGLVLTAAHDCGATNRDVQFTFADGSIHALRTTTAMKILQALATRAGNEAVSSEDY